MIISYDGYDIHPLTYLHMVAEMRTIHGTGIVPEYSTEIFEIFIATNFVDRSGDIYRRIDVSTYRRIDVSQYRRIDVSACRRIDVSQYRRTAVLQTLHLYIVVLLHVYLLCLAYVTSFRFTD